MVLKSISKSYLYSLIIFLAFTLFPAGKILSNDWYTEPRMLLRLPVEENEMIDTCNLHLHDVQVHHANGYYLSPPPTAGFFAGMTKNNSS